MRRIGECNKCGKCCEKPTFERLETYRKAGIKPDSQYLDGCPYLENGSCNDYENRNQMCWDFPRSPIDIETIPECGYSFVKEE